MRPETYVSGRIYFIAFTMLINNYYLVTINLAIVTGTTKFDFTFNR